MLGDRNKPSMGQGTSGSTRPSRTRLAMRRVATVVSVAALLSLVPTFALLFVIGWSLAVCTGLANVMFQDSQHLVEVGMQIMF